MRGTGAVRLRSVVQPRDAQHARRSTDAVRAVWVQGAGSLAVCVGDSPWLTHLNLRANELGDTGSAAALLALQYLRVARY